MNELQWLDTTHLDSSSSAQLAVVVKKEMADFEDL